MSRRPFVLCAQALVFVLLTVAAHAQGPAPAPLFTPGPASSSTAAATPSTFPSPAPAIERADLEPFLDGLINSQLENRDLAGACVAVVKDGQLVLAKGYGYADFEKKIPVSEKGTLFRPGSIAKLFTATAVMQQVELGKLELDRDVREYLDFEIKRSFPEPITLRRILTHTAGFEESVKELFGAGEPVPLREYLLTHMPAQIFRPGTVPSYSNYALSVAGYIVERSSGEPFDSYIDAHILKPLGMISSSFAQPLPGELNARMSNGYLLGSKAPKPFEICNPAPAGALSTTALDMSRFMLAFLNGGTLDGATILQPQTIETMQTRVFELHPQLHAIGLSFLDYSQHGHAIWGHAGDTFYFHSDMWLIPDARVGVYLSYNSGGAHPGSGRGELFRDFLARYFPEVEMPAAPPAEGAEERAREVSGVYETSRRSETNTLKITALLGQTTVTASGPQIVVKGAKNSRGQLKQWREVAPLLYEEIGGPDRLAFRRDASGRITEMLPNVPITLGQRVSGLRSKAVVLPLLIASLGLMVLTALLWPVAAAVRKRFGHTVSPDRATVWLQRGARVVCLLIIAMIALLAIPFTQIQNDIAFLGTKADPYLWTSKILGWISCFGLIVLVAAAVRMWRSAEVTLWARLHATLLALGAAIFLAFAWQWHLLSPSVQF